MACCQRAERLQKEEGEGNKGEEDEMIEGGKKLETSSHGTVSEL